MNGRWVIHSGYVADGPPCRVRVPSSVEGPEQRTPMPVVPCDDAAVKRATAAVGREFSRGFNAWSDRSIAEAVLRAAGALTSEPTTKGSE